MIRNGSEYPGKSACKCWASVGAKSAPGGESWHYGREPLRIIQVTYLDNQNLLWRSSSIKTNAEGVGSCNAVAVTCPLAVQSSVGEVFANGDVDAFPALKSRIKGR
jgi:hypothetical protein